MNERPPHPGLTRYRVRDTAHGGATIRLAPHQHAGILGRLKPGDEWHGEPTPGQRWSAPGFGSTNIWIRSDDMRWVWSGLLEKVSE